MTRLQTPTPKADPRVGPTKLAQISSVQARFRALTITTRITASIARYGVKESGKIEILFGEANEPLPFRHYQLRDIQRAGEKLIRTEVVGAEVLKGWQEYADLLFLAAIASVEKDLRQAGHTFGQGMALWDGVGFRDRAAKAAGKYAVYKLALALLAAGKLNASCNDCHAIFRAK